MIKHLLGLSCICLLFACGNNSSENANTDAKFANTEDVHCYIYNDSSNIISLRATFVKDSVSGALNYDIFEKDKNSGTILGIMKGDLLIADYTFVSEGKTSVREVVFKKTGSNLVGGVGEMEEKNGKMVFKDMDKLNFEHAVVLAEVDCNK